MNILTKKRAMRLILEGEIVMALVSFALQWLIYGAYVHHSCVGRPIHDHWKDVFFCVTRDEHLVWKTVDAASTGALLALFATFATIKLHQYLTDPTATRNSR